MRSRLLFGLAAAALLMPVPALAQTSEPLPDPEDVANQDGFTVGLGAGFAPDYEGSDNYRLIPGGAIRGKVGGVSFTTRGLYLYVDVVDTGSKVDFDFGPIAGVRLNRTRKVEDDLIDVLPERKTAVELGGFAGVSFKGVTNPYGTLAARLDVVKDVGDAHESTVFTPNLEFSTPLSRTFFIGASLSADFVSGDYADYYFSITPADALASTLPVYDADGGMKSWKVGLLANHSLSGDLRRGLSIFALGSYSRLVGDFEDSPIVDDRGSAGQWFGALGLAYSW
jgi:outer membrane scaffolding protein for murein synthesis (MipA/OmpV family)